MVAAGVDRMRGAAKVRQRIDQFRLTRRTDHEVFWQRVVPAPLRVMPGQRRLICREDADAKMLAIGIDAQVVRGTLDAPQHKRGIQ